MKLELYYRPGCPFCRKVLHFIDSNKIQDVKHKDIVANPAFATELINAGGKSQVPCLFIDGEPLYESDDIIERLKSFA